MNNFKMVLEKYSSFDLGHKGDRFTQNNKHENATFTKQRLDREMANQYW